MRLEGGIGLCKRCSTPYEKPWPDLDFCEACAWEEFELSLADGRAQQQALTRLAQRYKEYPQWEERQLAYTWARGERWFPQAPQVIDAA